MKEVFRHYDLRDGEEEDKLHHITVCTLWGEETGEAYGVVLAEGIAICCYLDQYNRKLGNRIAKGRALKALSSRHSSNPLKPRWVSLLLHEFKCEYYPNGGSPQ